ncbi:MAG TPA: hypothetical protein VIX73_29190 [Kofleriaceae bacterium]|jgi:hypothetical protein
MTARSRLRRFALSSVLFVVAACGPSVVRDDLAATSSSATASAGGDEPASSDAYGHRRCDRGIQACKASQAGQPCNPDNLNIVCTPQDNGSFCCLAVASQ